jgi:hypothetical protein
MAQVYWIGGTGSQSLATTANYSTGALPAAGDTLWFQQGSSTIDSGLTALAAIAIAGINVTAGFGGTIGTNGNSPDAMSLNGGATVNNINAPNCSRIVIDFGTQTHTTTVISTGVAADAPLEAVRLRGGSTSSILYVTGGTVGVCTSRPGLTANLAEFDVSGGGTTGTAQFNSNSGGTLNLGPGVTWAAGNQKGGTLTTFTGTSGTLKQWAGTLTTGGTAKITTLDIGGSAVINHRPASGSAVDTLIVQGSGSADWSQDPAPFTITNAVKIYRGASLFVFDQANSTFTAGLDCIECGLEDVTLELGKGITISVAAG